MYVCASAASASLWASLRLPRYCAGSVGEGEAVGVALAAVAVGSSGAGEGVAGTAVAVEAVGAALQALSSSAPMISTEGRRVRSIRVNCNQKYRCQPLVFPRDAV